MKTTLKINKKTGKNDKLKSTQQQTGQQKTTTTKQKTSQTKKRSKNNKNKIIELLTVAPELVTLDCSLTNVLQTLNTQPYHS